jgi:excisionase family DNA binding protein
MTDQKWFIASEVCSYAGISRRTLSRMVLDGEIRYTKRRGRLHFYKAWVDAWLLGYNSNLLTGTERKNLEELGG